MPRPAAARAVALISSLVLLVGSVASGPVLARSAAPRRSRRGRADGRPSGDAARRHPARPGRGRGRRAIGLGRRGRGRWDDRRRSDRATTDPDIAAVSTTRGDHQRHADAEARSERCPDARCVDAIADDRGRSGPPGPQRRRRRPHERADGRRGRLDLVRRAVPAPGRHDRSIGADLVRAGPPALDRHRGQPGLHRRWRGDARPRLSSTSPSRTTPTRRPAGRSTSSSRTTPSSPDPGWARRPTSSS